MAVWTLKSIAQQSSYSFVLSQTCHLFSHHDLTYLPLTSQVYPPFLLLSLGPCHFFLDLLQQTLNPSPWLLSYLPKKINSSLFICFISPHSDINTHGGLKDKNCQAASGTLDLLLTYLFSLFSTVMIRILKAKNKQSSLAILFIFTTKSSPLLVAVKDKKAFKHPL